MDVIYLIQKYGRIRNLSPKTINTYCTCLTKFLRRYKNKDPRQITKKDVEDYLYWMVKMDKAPKTMNVYLSSCKFFFDVILKKKLLVHLPSAKTPRRLPVFVTKDEAKLMFQEITNEKHKLMILLLYSAGMRVSELIKIKVRDLELEQSYGWVRQGKGRKDRLFVIAKKLKERLAMWIKSNNLSAEDWLFQSYNGRHLTTKTVQEVIRKAAKKAKIQKNVTPHTLRHSFATHLIENGYSVTEVQHLLGHNRLDTTMTYVHMAANKIIGVESPLDSFDEEN